MSCFGIVARIALPASKRILELAKYIANLATVFSISTIGVEKRYMARVLGHFCSTEKILSLIKVLLRTRTLRS